MHPRVLPLLAAALVLAAPAAAAQSEAVGQTEPDRPEPRALSWALEPGEVRTHAVALELDTQLTAVTGPNTSVRRTSTALSFLVTAFGLRRERSGQDGSYIDTVVELTVDNFHLEVLTEGGGSAVTITMDDEGVTVRHDRERPSHVPWTSIPPGRGGQIGELLGRPVTCAISRDGRAVRIDGRMRPWTQVLDSIDLIPLIMPLVPVPDDEVQPGSIWAIHPYERSVTLSQPWEELNLATATDVTVTAFEQHDGVDAARLSFTYTTELIDGPPRLDYALEITGELLVGFDGAVLEGTATVALEAKTTVVDTNYELTGTGTLRFGAPQADGADAASTPPADE